MTPDMHSIMRARYWSTCILRTAALLMLAWATLQIVGTAIQQLPFLENNRPLHTLSLIAWPMRWLLVAFILIAAEKRLIQWLVPLPSSGCPRCAYPIAGRSLCPECGLELSPPAPLPSAQPTSPLRPAARKS